GGGFDAAAVGRDVNARRQSRAAGYPADGYEAGARRDGGALGEAFDAAFGDFANQRPAAGLSVVGESEEVAGRDDLLRLRYDLRGGERDASAERDRNRRG